MNHRNESPYLVHRHGVDSASKHSFTRIEIPRASACFSCTRIIESSASPDAYPSCAPPYLNRQSVRYHAYHVRIDTSGTKLLSLETRLFSSASSSSSSNPFLSQLSFLQSQLNSRKIGACIQAEYHSRPIHPLNCEPPVPFPSSLSGSPIGPPVCRSRRLLCGQRDLFFPSPYPISPSL